MSLLGGNMCFTGANNRWQSQVTSVSQDSRHWKWISLNQIHQREDNTTVEETRILHPRLFFSAEEEKTRAHR